MVIALYIAALMIVGVGFAHSYLGERYILARLSGRNLPKVLGSAEYTLRTLRFAWHVTSFAWFGFAAILVLLARGPVSPATLGKVIGVTFLIHFAIALVGSRGKHLSWIAFLAIGAATIYATHTG
jgi:hypothetical protein